MTDSFTLVRNYRLIRTVGTRDGIVPEGLFGYQGRAHYICHLAAYEAVLPFVENQRVLDLGCGSGYGALFLASRGAKEVIGLDVDQNAVALSSRLRQHIGLRWTNGSGERLPFVNNCFDVVTSFQVIEHVPDVVAYLGEIKRVLRPGGICFLSTPNRENYWRRMAKPNPHHLREYSLEEITELVRSVLDNVVSWCQYYYTPEAEAIARKIQMVADQNWGVRLLVQNRIRSKLVHLCLPHALRNSYFCSRTGHPLDWYQTRHVGLRPDYDDLCFKFLVQRMKG